MKLSAEVFSIARSRNKNLFFAFTEAFKVTVYKKTVVGDFACPMAIQKHFKYGIIHKINIDSALCGIAQS
jgi:hypothetical protein